MTVLPVFSGIDRPERLQLLKKMNALAMVNARIATMASLLEVYEQYQEILFALDSGAFQGFFDIHQYIDIIHQVGPYFRYISNLDVIGDQRASNKNFEYLQTHLPANLAQKVMWVFQPDGSFEELVERAQTAEIVGIGGMVPMLKRQEHERVLAHLRQVNNYLYHMDALVHVFGIGSPRVIRELVRFQCISFFDTAKWLVAFKAGEILRRSGTNQCKGQDLDISLSLDMMAESNILTITHWANSRLAHAPKPILFTYNVSFVDLHRNRLIEIPDPESFETQFGGIPEYFDGRKIAYRLQGTASMEKQLLKWCKKATHRRLIADYEICFYGAEDDYDEVWYSNATGYAS